MIATKPIPCRELDEILGQMISEKPCAWCGVPIGPGPIRASGGKMYHPECRVEGSTVARLPVKDRDKALAAWRAKWRSMLGKGFRG